MFEDVFGPETIAFKRILVVDPAGGLG